ncbi:metallophosphoesterase [Abyssisolibacter fermentans]|uniref:metallophosphoesterase n=1 Tax=Abyssisolibacter fermentans TaxID=1766203 RepID=UPI0008364AA0|nr:metallophosphoesterase [Abyssisolibacter fermentans]
MMIFIIPIVIVIIYFYISTNYIRINKINVASLRKYNLKYIHITDIHGKIRFINGRLSDLVNKEKPDFVLLTGDMISKLSELDKVISDLKKIKCRIYIVLGNYERECYNHGHKESFSLIQIEEAIKSANNLKLLINEDVIELINGIRICVYGFDNSSYGNEIYRSSDKKYDYRILLAHSPNIIKLIEDKGISYNHLLVGHTHGGQIRLGKIYKNAYSKFHIGDLYDNEGRIFTINKGIGTTRIPLRINATPEIRCYEI